MTDVEQKLYNEGNTSGYVEGYLRGVRAERQRITGLLPDAESSDYCYRIFTLSNKLKRLERVLAKELSENDELGSEFVYVNVLRQDVQRLRKTLEQIAVAEGSKAHGEVLGGYLMNLAREALLVTPEEKDF